MMFGFARLSCRHKISLTCITAPVMENSINGEGEGIAHKYGSSVDLAFQVDLPRCRPAPQFWF